MERDKRFDIPTVDDMKNTYDIDSFKSGKHIMATLVSESNHSDDIPMALGMLSAFMTSHRTLQQSVMRILILMVCEWAKRVEAEPAMFTDLRNEASADFAKEIAKKAPGFPLI